MQQTSTNYNKLKTGGKGVSLSFLLPLERFKAFLHPLPSSKRERRKSNRF